MRCSELGPPPPKSVFRVYLFGNEGSVSDLRISHGSHCEYACRLGCDVVYV
jgi:hypothetical protein